VLSLFLVEQIAPNGSALAMWRHSLLVKPELMPNND
jgi:hypothetical protein